MTFTPITDRLCVAPLNVSSSHLPSHPWTWLPNSLRTPSRCAHPPPQHTSPQFTPPLSPPLHSEPLRENHLRMSVFPAKIFSPIAARPDTTVTSLSGKCLLLKLAGNYTRRARSCLSGPRLALYCETSIITLIAALHLKPQPCFFFFQDAA